jgi:ribose 5-phosphate isomerase
MAPATPRAMLPTTAMTAQAMMTVHLCCWHHILGLGMDSTIRRMISEFDNSNSMKVTFVILQSQNLKNVRLLQKRKIHLFEFQSNPNLNLNIVVTNKIEHWGGLSS